MRVAQPAVLVGAYDWDETLLPRAEYQARIKQVFAKLDGDIAGVVVYGNKVDNGALAYLTNFAPKIESGMALVTRDGKVRVHGAGSPHMMVNAKMLTWTEDVRPLRDPAKNIADWAEESGIKGTLAFWTTEAMPTGFFPRVQAGLGERKLVDVSGQLNALLREKSLVALKLMRDGCGILDKAMSTIKEFFSGTSAREAAVAAEKTATRAGAQDVRVLISLSKGGTPTAIDYPESGKHDPLLAYVALRYAGYWADGFITLCSTPNQTLDATQAALKAMLAKAKAGTTTAELRDIAQSALGSLPIHPAARKPAVGIGLMLEEPEEGGAVAQLEAGRVYSLRAGAHVSTSDNALLSAMVLVKADGVDVLWSALR